MNTDLILINGDIVDSKEAVIDYNDRGHQFGDGVFEIVPVYNGKVFRCITARCLACCRTWKTCLLR